MVSTIKTAIDTLKAFLEWLKSSLIAGPRPSPAPQPATIKKGGNKRGARGQRGSALSEFGPALFFLFIFAVFPVLDIIGLCFGYLSCCTMNDLQLREASKLPKSQATMQCGVVQQTIPQKFMGTVLGSLSGITDLPTTAVEYNAGQRAIYVNVTTTVSVRPFLAIPFFNTVPGLGAPASFTISNSRVLENPRFAIQ